MRVRPEDDPGPRAPHRLLAEPGFPRDADEGQHEFRARRQELEEALRLSPDRNAGAEIYATCAGCHRSGGEGAVDGSYPRLAGQHRSVIMKQLADIRADRISAVRRLLDPSNVD